MAPAAAATLEVLDPDGAAVLAYRWMVEEDTTHHVMPGQTCMNGDLGECLSVDFHRSYTQPIARGTQDDPLPTLPAGGHYFVSVLPTGGFAMSGAPIAPGQDTVRVVLNAQPIPTAQIRVFVFEDNFPINNAPDTPEEVGLQGFQVLLADGAGRFGMAGGQAMADAFGNPLGTVYNPDGSVAVMGSGVILSDENGIAVIKNLAPAKYGVQIVPPAGHGWVQTATIEGSKTIDAWVKANEPPFFTEFGPPGPHVFVGFVRDATTHPDAWPALQGGTTVRGQVRQVHVSRPPEVAFYTGHAAPGCWVGLNDLAVGAGQGLIAVPCDDDSNFVIPNVPPGDYQLAIWDESLLLVFGSYGFTVPAGVADLNLTDVPVFPWFGRLEAQAFYDANENGLRDCVTPECDNFLVDEVGMPEIAVNLRFRDGTMYQSVPTDVFGAAPFDAVFPFFSWLVAEVDFARFKVTGATFTVDAGGPVDPTDPWSWDGWTSPQPQPENGGLPYRTETGVVLTAAIQTFLSGTNAIQWGIRDYPRGENGGISGIVYYATTRAEDDPTFAAAEEWEPGIPRMQVNLYQDLEADGFIDDLDGDGGETPADVDNSPFNWRPDPEDPGKVLERGPEDFDYNNNGVFDPGDAIQIVTTDSWDDSKPTGCVGEVFMVDDVYPTDCFDGLRNFNQIRPGVFDGGYAFDSYLPGGVGAGLDEIDGLPRGAYIVEVGEHPVYELAKPEDRNVDFGDTYAPADPFLPGPGGGAGGGAPEQGPLVGGPAPLDGVVEIAPPCVGPLHEVPDTFSLFDLGEPPPDAGSVVALCNRKQAIVRTGRNAAADFFLFTSVPIAAHVVGFILDDLSNEFDPNAPNFGEKYSPPFLPVSFRDWTGREISRVYSDRWGRYNALLPSTFTANLPMPSGMSPAMLIACMNSPGPIPNPAHANDPSAPELIVDPYYQPQYSQFCYTFQYMPGTTTYLDTPVVPVAAFTGPGQYPVDCQPADHIPAIHSVAGPVGGPYVRDTNQLIAILSMGDVEVPNPAFDADLGTSRTVVRDHGFGDLPGMVTVGGVPLEIIAWTDAAIIAKVQTGVETGQLLVTRGDNLEATPTGVTLNVGGRWPVAVPPGGSIQAAIDAARPGDLVLVPPGVYEELVILWKPIRLQGWGPGSVVINAAKAPGEKLQAWRDKVEMRINNGDVSLLPSQEIGFALPEPTTLFTEEGPGIIVLAAETGGNRFTRGRQPRIDGFSITGADHGGGIFVNGYANWLEISNNRVFGNAGVYTGGIRVGHPFLVLETNDGLQYQDGFNDSISIHHNAVVANGGGGGFGGGVSVHHGTDRYAITDNLVCGNYSMGDGGGIAHHGVSDNGLIARNQILFNESFNQGTAVSGGGLFIGGAAPLAGSTLSPGTGRIKVDQNLIQGNLAGAGDGGGVRMQFVNGADVAADPDLPGRWHNVVFTNNIVVDNIAGLAAGGISLQDAARVFIDNNTIANNDSTATAGEAFAPGSPNESTMQPAGVVGRAHSDELEAALGTHRRVNRYHEFSNPFLRNNIIRHNRSFIFMIDPFADPPDFRLVPDLTGGDTAVYTDLAVLGTFNPEHLFPQSCVLSETTDPSPYQPDNLYPDAAAPMFVREYHNGDRGQTLQQIELTSSIAVQPAFDEGGNFIQVRFGPLAPRDPATGEPFGNYHLDPLSPAADAGRDSILPGNANALLGDLLHDLDGQVRPDPINLLVDVGADEWQPVP